MLWASWSVNHDRFSCICLCVPFRLKKELELYKKEEFELLWETLSSEICLLVAGNYVLFEHNGKNKNRNVWHPTMKKTIFLCRSYYRRSFCVEIALVNLQYVLQKPSEFCRLIIAYITFTYVLPLNYFILLVKGFIYSITNTVTTIIQILFVLLEKLLN